MSALKPFVQKQPQRRIHLKISILLLPIFLGSSKLKSICPNDSTVFFWGDLQGTTFEIPMILRYS